MNEFDHQHAFIIGPLRTGSSLLTRCLDDHPQMTCWCESEINRVLFAPHLTHLHFLRMRHHGLGPLEIVRLLDRKRQGNVDDVFRWYEAASAIARSRWGKPDAVLIGDKSPDFYQAPALANELREHHRLIYSIRDPRAVFASIETSEGSSDDEKRNRWAALGQNWAFWKDAIDRSNVLTSRYEDLVSNPETAMASVYQHLGLPMSHRFLEPFERRFPSRFLWKTAVDWESGIRKDFDASRVTRWKSVLTTEHLEFVRRDPVAQQIMKRFDYEW